jgi:flagella basal body P-ring formation protein FlgA
MQQEIHRVSNSLIKMIAAATGTAAMLALSPALALADLSDALRAEIGKSYPGARIELTSAVRWTRGSEAELPEVVSHVINRGETPRNELSFAILDADSADESAGTVSFAAWMPARVALKRILPGQALTEEMFKTQEINVAAAPAREYRGVIMEPKASLARTETRQTVLEGQFLVSSAVQRMPDLRRGDSVRVYLLSNGLSLSTQGIAEEPAYVDGQVKVMTGKAKRELVGRLNSSGVVEVKL